MRVAAALLARAGARAGDPARAAPRRAGCPDAPKRGEVEELLAGARRRGPARAPQPRAARARLLAPACAAPRRSGLDLADVDFEQELVHVRNGKGAKDRIVPLGEEAAHWLARYLRESRPALARGAEDALFLSARGRRLDTSTLRRLMPAPAPAAARVRDAPARGRRRPARRSRSCSATRPCRRRRSTATSTRSAYAVSTTARTRARRRAGRLRPDGRADGVARRTAPRPTTPHLWVGLSSQGTAPTAAGSCRFRDQFDPQRPARPWLRADGGQACGAAARSTIAAARRWTMPRRFFGANGTTTCGPRRSLGRAGASRACPISRGELGGVERAAERGDDVDALDVALREQELRAGCSSASRSPGRAARARRDQRRDDDRARPRGRSARASPARAGSAAPARSSRSDRRAARSRTPRSPGARRR